MTRVLPAEWAPQAAVMLTWPHDNGPWSGALDTIEPVFDAIAVAILARQPLLIVTADPNHAHHVRARLRRAGAPLAGLRLAQAPSNDVWARDHGPLTVFEDGRPLLLDFRFNGWGGKFRADEDDAITARLHAQGVFGQTPLVREELVLEGGAIETDGRGTLLAREPCLVDPQHRNPGLSRADMEAHLRRLLGISRCHWLQHGHLDGDDTDSHIDTLARFADTGTIVYQACTRRDDSHYEALQAMAAELAQLRTSAGQPYRLVPLPLPPAIEDTDGRRLPAGYANFLIINGAVLAPVYGVDTDQEAVAQARAAFPAHHIEPINCRQLIEENGSLHCVTMQIPEGVEIEGQP